MVSLIVWSHLLDQIHFFVTLKPYVNIFWLEKRFHHLKTPWTANQVQVFFLSFFPFFPFILLKENISFGFLNNSSLVTLLYLNLFYNLQSTEYFNQIFKPHTVPKHELIRFYGDHSHFPMAWTKPTS